MGRRGETVDRMVDTWTWYDREVVLDSLKFEVRMKRPKDVSEGKVTYYIKSAAPPLELEAHDPEKLRKKLDAAVRAFFAVKWEPVIQIAYSAGKHEEGFGLSGKLDTSFFEKGVYQDGRPIYRKKRETPRKSGHAPEYDFYIQKGGPYHHSDDQVAYIPDTKENRAQLKAFQTAMAGLLETIGERLHADNITGTLSSGGLAFNRLLNALPKRS